MTEYRGLRLAVLISGGGTTLLNLQRLIQAGELAAEVALVVASRNCVGVERAEQVGFAPEIVRTVKGRPEEHSQQIFERCRQVGAELVVLAGYLSQLIIPDDYQNRVMNIHPALIPAFCGQGMYGEHVHAAVVARGCKVSGCTVHFCDNEYDHGPIILQQTVPVTADDTPDDVAARVFAAECEAYPEAIRLFAERRLRVKNGLVEILDAVS